MSTTEILFTNIKEYIRILENNVEIDKAALKHDKQSLAKMKKALKMLETQK